MKIGILETGEVHPDLKARYGDYPAMFEALLRSADPTLEFAVVRVVAGEMPAAPTQADAWLVTGSRHGVYDDLPWIEPLKAFLRACGGRPGAGHRHLLRPPDPRRGAGRPGGEVRQGLGPGRAGLRTRLPARHGWTASPIASRSVRCTRIRWLTCHPAPPCSPGPRTALCRPCLRRPRGTRRDQPAAPPRVRPRVHGRASCASRRHRLSRRGRRLGAGVAGATGREHGLGAASRRLPAPDRGPRATG